MPGAEGISSNCAIGAITAYAEITAETWKPYEAPAALANAASREFAAVEMAAFEMEIQPPRPGWEFFAPPLVNRH
jgi:hypothetical protein